MLQTIARHYATHYVKWRRAPMPKEARNIVKTVRYSDYESDAIRAAASQKGEVSAEYIHRVSVDRARRDLRKAGK